MRLSAFVAALALCAATPQISAQTTAPTLEERMSQAEFRNAGLDKLSPEELANLNAWIGAHGGSIRYVTPNGAAVFDTDQGDRIVVESAIKGTFRGWREHTVFTLENGQQWVPAESGGFDAGTFDSPKVRIKPMMLGSWLMVVEGCSCSVRVRRVK